MGAICSIPAFEKKGVIELAKKALNGEDVDIDDCCERLTPVCAEGGIVDMDLEFNQKGLREFHETGKGRIRWEPDAEGDLDERTILIKGFAPKSARLGLAASLERTKNDDAVQSVVNESDIGKGSVYRVVLKQRIAHAKLEETMRKVCGHFTTAQTLAFTVTKRFPPEEEGAEADVAFDYCDTPRFFDLWAKWRIRMERRAIVHKRRLTEAAMARDDILLLAAVNREIVFQSLKADDSAKYLMRKLDIDEPTAKAILELRVRQLKVLEEKALKKRIADAKKRIAALKRQYDDPVPGIEERMDEAIA